VFRYLFNANYQYGFTLTNNCFTEKKLRIDEFIYWHLWQNVGATIKDCPYMPIVIVGITIKDCPYMPIVMVGATIKDCLYMPIVMVGAIPCGCPFGMNEGCLYLF
jgi:hypothetical protein